MITRLAPAKINLALHVTGQRGDGYHLLDTIVTFAEIGDRITIEKPHHPHGPIQVTAEGLYSEGLDTGPKNLVTAAAMMLRENLISNRETLPPVEIFLEKNLPIASGVGGGSADAAATLLGLKEFWGAEFDDIAPIAKALGADVPMCLLSKPLRARGIGDEIQLLTSERQLDIVLVNPNLEVSTPDVFNALETKENDSIDYSFGQFPSVAELQSMRNDLQPAAISCQSVITKVLCKLDQTNPSLSRMSGSGATCFGIYDDAEKAEVARQEISSDHPDWWCVATKTVLS